MFLDFSCSSLVLLSLHLKKAYLIQSLLTGFFSASDLDILFYFILHQQCPRSSPVESWTSTKACWSVGACQSRCSLWEKAVENSYAAVLMSLSHSVDHYC